MRSPRRRPRALLAFVALPCAIACGSPPAPEAPVAPPQPAPPVAPVVQAAPPDVSEVPAPATLVVTGRLARPAASLGVVRGWSQLPLIQAEEIAELLAGPQLGPLVDLDAPIDFALGVEGEGLSMRPLFAVSAGVRDPDVAKATLSQKFTLVPGPGGVLIIQSSPAQKPSDPNDDTDDDGGDGRYCELAPAFGAPSTRIVCAPDGERAAIALRELGPWLTRTAPRAAPADDLSADLTMKPLRSTLEGFRSTLGVAVTGLFGGASAGDAALGLANQMLDFALDLDSAGLRIDLTDAVASARSTARFSGAKSGLTRMLLLQADGGAAPPRTFWQLPADASMAFYERGWGDENPGKGRMDELLLGQVIALIDKALEEAGLKAADRGAIVSALHKVPWTSPVAYASGLDPAAVDAGAAAAKDPSASRDAPVTIARELSGWRLIEIEQPPKYMGAVLNELSRAIARPAVAKLLAGGKGLAPPTFQPSPLPTGVKLPAGSLHFALDLHSPHLAGAGKAPTCILHLFLVPDGPRSWIGIGGDAALVASRVTGSVAAPGEPRAELAPLDRDKVGAAGFLNVRSLPEAVVQLLATAGDSAPDAFAILQSVATLPNKGLTPVVYSFTANPDSTAVGSLQVPRGAIEDAIVLALAHSP